MFSYQLPGASPGVPSVAIPVRLDFRISFGCRFFPSLRDEDPPLSVRIFRVLTTLTNPTDCARCYIIKFEVHFLKKTLLNLITKLLVLKNVTLNIINIKIIKKK